MDERTAATVARWREWYGWRRDGLSLGAIAARAGVSRQAVHKALKRLARIDRNRRAADRVAEIQSRTNEPPAPEPAPEPPARLRRRRLPRWLDPEGRGIPIEDYYRHRDPYA